MPGARVRDLVVHLRLPFQAALSAVFLWGVFLSSGRFSPATAVAWIAFAVGLQGGATAFNSYYDRDEGPVGGLRRPPPVTRSLLPFSIAVQAAGLALATSVSARLALAYLAGVALFFAYSHPSIRTKARPWISLATVSTASGPLALLAGAWAAAGGIPRGAAPRIAGGAISAALVIAGFYPLTQIGQVDEDRRRGDRTFAAVYGREASFAWAMVVLSTAAILNAALAASVAGWGPAAGLAAALAAVGFSLRRWRREPALDASARMDTLAYATAAAHATIVAWRTLAA